MARLLHFAPLALRTGSFTQALPLLVLICFVQRLSEQRKVMISVLGNGTSADQLYIKMQDMRGDVVPDFELKIKAELAVEINRLKIEKNAVILGHNYMEPALFHSIPDYVGDSLDLARRAAET